MWAKLQDYKVWWPASVVDVDWSRNEIEVGFPGEDDM